MIGMGIDWDRLGSMERWNSRRETEERAQCGGGMAECVSSEFRNSGSLFRTLMTAKPSNLTQLADDLDRR